MRASWPCGCITSRTADNVVWLMRRCDYRTCEVIVYARAHGWRGLDEPRPARFLRPTP